jgi:thiosulfate/3-mercaptopyruvate sulfurtransferase
MNSVEYTKRNGLKKRGKLTFFIAAIWMTFSISTSAWGQGNRSFLAETKWLANRLTDPDLAIIDASPTKEYLSKHIKNAVSASFSAQDHLSYGIDTSYGGTDLISDPNSAMPWTDGPPEHIQEVMRSLGINNDSTVVIYDGGAFFHATRFFWTLTHYGHKNVFILNGGLSKWVSDGFPTVQQIPEVKRGNFASSVIDHSAVVNTDYVLMKLFKPDTVVVNAVTSTWHYGTHLAYSKPGHIPGSINAPYPDYFQKDKTWRPKNELRRMFASLGIVPEKEVIAYCGGNPAGAALYFTLRYVLGYPNVKFYMESLTGWLKDQRDLPLHTFQNEHLIRDPLWVQWWAGKRIQYLVRDPETLVVDVRSKEKYIAGHIPYAINIPVNDLMNAGISKSDL